MLGQSVSRTSTVSNSNSGEPVLKAVLASLDIQIDEELARYRRHRLVQRRSQPTPSSKKAPSMPAPPSKGGTALPSMTATPPQVPSSSPELMPSPWDEPDTVAIAPSLYAQPPRDDGAAVMPDDYLESSEHLLRSLTDGESELPYEESLMDRLLTPVGMGALFLMLLSSAMLGFLIVNPSMLGIERWGTLFQRQDSESSAPIDESSMQLDAETRRYPNLAADEFVDLSLDTLSTLPGRSPILSPLAAKPSPNPAASPATSTAAPPPTVSLATIGVNGAAPTIISTTDLPSNPLPVADPAPAPAPEVAPEPEPLPEVAPEPVAAAPAYVEPAPAPASVAAAPAPSTDPSSYYYVVTDYSGDRSLEDAQSIVDDAYVRNFDDGAQVQLGAFSTPERAQELIEELQQQGISAELYQP